LVTIPAEDRDAIVMNPQAKLITTPLTLQQVGLG